jgi:hypothetical protein
VVVVGNRVTEHEFGLLAGRGQLERHAAGPRIAGLPGQLKVMRGVRT